MNRYLFIVNPTSGKGRGEKAIPIIKEHCEAESIDYNILITERSKHAIELCRDNINNYENIIAVGGDGTVNEVLNGILDLSQVIFGVLPVGSGNDFVKNLGFNDSIKDNLSTLTTSKMNEIINIDVGILEYKESGTHAVANHMFINNLGVGFDAYVSYLNQSNKTFSGIISYIFAVIKALFNYKMIIAEILIDEIKHSGPRLMVSIGNGKCSGGGFYLNPNAIINDGELDVSVFESITRRRLLTALPLALMNKLEKVPEANLLRSKKEVDIKLRNPYYLHCEGEVISTKLIHAKISLNKSALKVIKKLDN